MAINNSQCTFWSELGTTFYFYLSFKQVLSMIIIENSYVMLTYYMPDTVVNIFHIIYTTPLISMRKAPILAFTSKAWRGSIYCSRSQNLLSSFWNALCWYQTVTGIRITWVASKKDAKLIPEFLIQWVWVGAWWEFRFVESSRGCSCCWFGSHTLRSITLLPL